MPEDSGEVLTCQNGHTFKITAPDRDHPRALAAACSRGDSIPKEHKCPECPQVLTVHWDTGHPEILFTG